MWPLTALMGWPHQRGFLLRKCVGVSPGQKNVAVITWWPYGGVPLYFYSLPPFVFSGLIKTFQAILVQIG